MDKKLEKDEKESGEEDSSNDCVMEDQNISTITINDTIIEEKQSEILLNNENNKTIIEVSFQNNKIYEKYSKKITESIEEILKNHKTSIELIEDSKANLIKFIESDIEKETFQFTIDTKPTDKKENEGPRYSRSKFDRFVMEEKLPEKLTDDGRGGGITNRMQFKRRPKYERYHIDMKQKFGHFIPGTISSELRNALGLGKKDLPSHIYQMRLYGYPPGWLEDAKISHSGLALFDSKGEIIPNSDEEDGEVDLDRETFDLSKIYDFPGFNVQPNFKFNDDSPNQLVPPMLPMHCKENMINKLKSKEGTPYKKKKLINLPGTYTKSTEDIEVVNMDIENIPDTFMPPMPDDDDNEKPPEPPGTEENESTSLDLDELENKHKQLLEEMEKLSEIPEIPETSETPQTPIKNNNTNTNTECITPISTKYETDGTPLLKFSSFTELPSGVNFSVGVSDVINFENLPDSTGKYDKMKGVIGKVREALNKLN